MGKFQYGEIGKELLSLHRESIARYKKAKEEIEKVYEDYGWGKRPTMFEHLKDDIRDLEKEYSRTKYKLLVRKIKRIRICKSRTLGNRKNVVKENENNLRIKF